MNNPSIVLLTGGADYIGSYTRVELLNAGYGVDITGNLCDSSPDVLDRIEKIPGICMAFQEVDIRDVMELGRLFSNHEIIHFADLKAVDESTQMPFGINRKNISGGINLLHTKKCHNLTSIVSSPSATVFGEPHTERTKEDVPTSVANPYSRLKLTIKENIQDLLKSYTGGRSCCCATSILPRYTKANSTAKTRKASPTN